MSAALVALVAAAVVMGSTAVVSRRLDRVAVGLGMIPRGEVGLIFASIGASLMLHGKPIIDSATYGAVVIMVVLTTLVTPPLIKWRFGQLSSP